MENKIKQSAYLSGITELGFVRTENIQDFYLAEASVFGKASESHDETDIKSIIVFLVPYNSGCTPDNLSVYAVGKDYHDVCTKIAEKISQPLKQAGYKCTYYTDNSPFNERLLASLAGLGIIGKNGFIINKKYGSYCFISCIGTNCILSPSTPENGKCTDCGRCIKSCPGKALTESSFDVNLCASYITQKKGDLTENEINIIKKCNSVWGCDICQKACPMNKNVQTTPFSEFTTDLILCIKNEYISNREFKKKYSDRAFSWRGKAVIDRNLSILDYKS